MFDIIAAVDDNMGIGIKYNLNLPWNIKEDMKHFKNKTINNVVIMGYNTYLTLKSPLVNRINIVISNDTQFKIDEKGVYFTDTLNNALEIASKVKNDHKNIFVIGGGKIYKSALIHKDLNKLIITHIKGDYKCDIMFPCNLNINNFQPLNKFELTDEATVVEYKSNISVEWSPEIQYIMLIRSVLEDGICKNDRTGVNTKSVFGKVLEFDMIHGFPLLTSKRVFWKGVVEELLWFLKGSTDVSLLRDKGVKIWEANAESFHNLFKPEDNHNPDDIGPVYGYQWRNFGGSNIKCVKCNTVNDITGVDQINNLINEIKTNPNSRRLIVNAWNPQQIPYMALPPCHMMFQCYVDTESSKLSLMMTQRSADIGLGLPFNIASYALLLHILAHFTNLKPHKLIISIGDAHIYNNHISALKNQIKRNLLKLPTLKVNAPKNINISSLQYNNFDLQNYYCHPTLKMDMAV